MRSAIYIFSLYICLDPLAVCANSLLCYDQNRMRSCVNDLYTNQVMDNVIRVHNRLPIVQLDYSKITATVTVETDPSLSGSDMLAWSRSTGLIPMRTLSKMRSLMQNISYGVSGKDTNVVTMSADPVTTQDSIYTAYLQYDRIPDSLMESSEPPPCGAAHIVRRCGRIYYWIPIAHRDDFFKLALTTTVLRGQPLSIPLYFDITVTGFVEIKKKDAGKQRFIELTVSPPLNNDNGVIYFQQKPGRLAFPFDENMPLGDLRTKIIVPVLATEDLTKLQDALLNQANVKAKLETFRPVMPTTQDLLKSLNSVGSEVQQLRLTQPR